MTEQEKAKKLLPIIQAIAEGKKIQYSFNGVTWFDEDVILDLVTVCEDIISDSTDYRIKPEVNYTKNRNCDLPACDDFTPKKEKHYRAFNNCDELVETYHKRAFIPILAEGLNKDLKKMYRPEIWVKHKHYGTENLIKAFENNSHLLF